MTLDAVGMKFLKDREGLRLNAYLDTAGIPTIGYGTTVYPSGKKVKLGDTCSLSEAEMYKAHDLVKFEEAVNSSVHLGELSFYISENGIQQLQHTSPAITQNQYNALVALCYNIGVQAFKDSTVLRRANSKFRNDKATILNAFMMWNKITVMKNGKWEKEVSPGLVNRRKKEVDLYFS